MSMYTIGVLTSPARAFLEMHVRKAYSSGPVYFKADILLTVYALKIYRCEISKYS